MSELSRPMHAGASARGRAPLAFAAFAVAFGPVFLEAFAHLQQHPWARYALLFPLLAVRLARREPAAPPRGDGFVLVAASLLLLACAALLGSFRLGRPAAGLAAVGLCRGLGIGSLRAQVLLGFAVPIPGSLAGRSAQVPATFLDWIERGATELGFEASASHLGLAIGTGVLEIDRYDGALTLVPLGVGLAFYLAAMRGLGGVATALALGLAAILAPALQLACIGAAALCVAFDLPAVGAWLVTHEWIAIALPGVLLAELGARPRTPR